MGLVSWDLGPVDFHPEAPHDRSTPQKVTREVIAMLAQVQVESVVKDLTKEMPVVILREIEGERVLPIWIGPGEASAIFMELADMKFARPLTHDLLANVIETFGGRLNEVKISRRGENLYVSEMHCQRGDDVHTIDARPSDAIAVALRMNAKIFTSEDLLQDRPPDTEDFEDFKVGKPKGADEEEAQPDEVDD